MKIGLDQFKSEFYAMTGEMARLGMERKAWAGIYPLRLPIGYRRVFVDGAERIEIVPEAARLVRLAFALAAKKRSSLTKILAVLHAESMKGYSGKLITRSALHRLLTNRLYFGVIPYKGAEIPGIQSALVSRGLFLQVEKRLKGRRKGS